jgi:hypothetical protein
MDFSFGKANRDADAGPCNHVEEGIRAETTEFVVQQIADSRLIDSQPASSLHLIEAAATNEARQLRHEHPAGGQTRIAPLAYETPLGTMLSRLDTHCASMIGPRQV